MRGTTSLAKRTDSPARLPHGPRTMDLHRGTVLAIHRSREGGHRTPDLPSTPALTTTHVRGYAQTERNLPCPQGRRNRPCRPGRVKRPREVVGSERGRQAMRLRHGAHHGKPWGPGCQRGTPARDEGLGQSVDASKCAEERFDRTRTSCAEGARGAKARSPIARRAVPMPPDERGLCLY